MKTMKSPSGILMVLLLSALSLLSMNMVGEKMQKQIAPLETRSEKVPQQPFVPLASGWDEQGQNIYRAEKRRLAEALTANPEAVLSYHVLPLEPVRTAENGFFRGFNGQGRSKWEPQTFTNFFTHLSATHVRYYVGFGTWIGPTLFFASQLVDHAYGLEGDPYAFANVETSLALNHDSAWASHVHINPLAVRAEDNNITTKMTALSPTPIQLEMHSSKAGNSCSGLGATHRCGGDGGVTWKVNGYTLPALLEHWAVPASNELFIKVDVESYECKLVPSWLPWLRAIKGPKPTFHLAFHSQISSCSHEEYLAVFEFASLYDNYPKGCMKDGKWTCGSGEWMLFDNL